MDNGRRKFLTNILCKDVPNKTFWFNNCIIYYMKLQFSHITQTLHHQEWFPFFIHFSENDHILLVKVSHNYCTFARLYEMTYFSNRNLKHNYFLCDLYKMLTIRDLSEIFKGRWQHNVSIWLKFNSPRCC